MIPNCTLCGAHGLQRGGACLDEVCGFRGTQSEAAGEGLRVAARERYAEESNSKRQSAFIGYVTKHYDHTLRTLSTGGEKVPSKHRPT